MYDYMKALQKRFDRQPHPDLDAQVEYAQEELRRDMDATGRKKLLRLLDAQVEYAQAELRRDMDAAGRVKLLRLLDAQNTLLVESKLMSFTAGFKLA